MNGRRARRWMVWAWAALGSASLAAAGTLTQRLLSDDVTARNAARQDAAGMSPQELKPTLSELSTLLRSEDSDQRERAAKAFVALGAQAAGAAPALEKALYDDFPYVRMRAGEALVHVGAPAVPIFIRALQKGNTEVRGEAASALAKCGPTAGAAIPALIRSLNDPDPPVTERAAHALQEIGLEAINPLLQVVETQHGNAVLLALQALGGIPMADETLVPRLARVLNSGDAQIRLAALKALTRQGAHHVPELAQALTSGDAKQRAQIADVLGDVGRPAAAAAPALTDLLKDSDAGVRASAARALGHLGSEASASAVPALKELLQDSDPNVQARAREALTNLTATTVHAASPSANDGVFAAPERQTPAAPVAAPPKKIPAAPKKALPKKKTAVKAKKTLTPAMAIARLASANPAAHASAQTALLQMGPIAVPELAQALQSGTTTVRQDAAALLIQIDSTTAVPVLSSAALQGSTEARLDALSALQTLGAGAAPAVPAVKDALNDPSPEIQTAAEGVLTKAGTADAKTALDAYHRAQQQKAIAVAVKSVRQGGNAGDEATADLVKIGAPAVRSIIPLLADARAETRRAAAKLLERIGAAAAAATNDLIKALDDPDADVRHAAAGALRKINTPAAKSALRWAPVKDKMWSVKGLFKK